MSTAKAQFEREFHKAINQYGDHHVDIQVTGNQVYAYYHSKHDSFPVTRDYSLHELGGIDRIMQYEDDYENLCVTCD